MCLLDSVQRWDEAAILCRAISHTSVENPLRQHGRLHAVSGLEYAAQAMAVHARLTEPEDDSGPVLGFLASARDLKFHVERLDTAGTELSIEARQLSAGEQGFIYEFDLRSGAKLLLSGRATVMLQRRAKA